MEEVSWHALWLSLVGAFNRGHLSLQLKYNGWRTGKTTGLIFDLISKTALLDIQNKFPNNTVEKNKYIENIFYKRLFDIEFTVSDDSFYFKDQHKYQKIYEKYEKDIKIRYLLSSYYLVNHFKYSRLQPRNGYSKNLYISVQESCINSARESRTYAKPLNESSFRKLKQEIKNRHKKLKKLISSQEKEIREAAKYSQEDAINPSPSFIKTLLPLLTLFFVTSGYLYMSIYTWVLGFDASHFLSIQDYIALSVPDILGITVVMIISFTFYTAFLKPTQIVLTETPPSIKKIYADEPLFLFMELIFWLLFFMVAIIFYQEWKYNDIIHWGGALIPILFLYTRFGILKFKIYTYFQNKLTFTLVCLIGPLFFTQLIWRAENEAHRVLKGTYIPKYVLNLEDNYKQFSDNKYLLKTENYVFLFNDADKSVAVIPKSAVLNYMANTPEITSSP